MALLSHNIPGAIPHTPPERTTQQHLKTLSPYIRQADEARRPPWHIKPRKLFDYLLVHILEGNGEFVIDGTQYASEPGSLFWIPPNTTHEMGGHAPSNFLQYIHFDLIYNPERSHWNAGIPGGTLHLGAWPQVKHPPLNDGVIDQWCGKLKPRTSTATEFMRRIVLEHNRTQTSSLALSGLMLQMIDHLLTMQQSASALTTHHAKTMESAMKSIQRNNQGKLYLEKLAAQYHLSPTHFRKLFRQHFNQSPRAAHTHAKIKIACDYLIYSSLNISEISDRLGFTTVHNFSRAFHKSAGQPPSAYRAGTAPPS